MLILLIFISALLQAIALLSLVLAGGSLYGVWHGAIDKTGAIPFYLLVAVIALIGAVHVMPV